jgi:hypothetical protein
MATIVLSTVGALVGGPIGGAIGAIVGQQIDQAIFGQGKAREGPRLKELDVQTSSYGTQIPAIFGALRVAGTVIWSTDLIERRKKSGGGKNRPSTIDYSYSASFAVALSSKPLAHIGRIWADGNLLRGAAGDFKSETLFRFHSGHGDQQPDPLLASAEQSGLCPAHRGLAYAVFEDFQLADYGNRIPSLTFEVFERDGAVGLADIVLHCSHGLITGSSALTLAGFAALGNDCRAALGNLLSTFPVITHTDGDQLRLSDWNDSVATHVMDDAALADGSSGLDPPKRTRQANSRAPATVSIRHYEPARDFQAGVQSSRRIGSARNDMQIELAAALGADHARTLADGQLLKLWRGLNGFSAAVPRGDIAISIGDWLSTGADSAALRITEVEHLRGTTRIIASEWPDSSGTLAIADPGRNLPDPDLPMGETQLILADLPAVGGDDPGKPLVVAAVAGTGPGWKRAALSMVDGDRIIDIGQSRAAATIGHLLDPLPLHSPMVFDQSSQPIIRLLHDGMALPTGSGTAVAFDAPALWLNGEIIRYADAEQLSSRDYRLSGLLRGCFDTRSAITHPTGTPLFLIDADDLSPIERQPLIVGSALEIEALGLADPAPAIAAIVVSGNAIVPRTPVHGAIERLTNGDILLRWIRRDRLNFAWVDGADMPESEGGQNFEVALSVGGQFRQIWAVAQPSLVIDAAEIGALAIPAGSTLLFSVRQLGKFAQSMPIELSHVV